MEIRRTLPLHPVPDGMRASGVGDVLSVDGLVAQRLELTHADLSRLERAVLEEPFVCEEGWSVPGLRWSGVRLSDIVALAQPLAAAAYVRAGSGPWVVPIPLADATGVLVCDQLNGEPLTLKHGAPWRLVPSGGPCFSNVKWLDHLELTAEPGEHDAARIARARLDQSAV